MIPVLSASQMRAADEAAFLSVSQETLIQRAGTAVAFAARELMGGCYGRRVTVLAGSGNNGKDGRVAAAQLRRWGSVVTVLDLDHAPDHIEGVDLFIDAAFGTGLRSAFEAPTVAAGILVLAVDLPSGVDADTGAVLGRALPADLTVTFQALKAGLLQGQGAYLAGRVLVVDLGINLEMGFAEPISYVLEEADLDGIPERGSADHKWSHAVGIVGGSPGMEGALALAVSAAMKAGATGVRAASIDSLPATPPLAIEAVRCALSLSELNEGGGEQFKNCQSLVLGPGLGRSVAKTEAILQLLATTTKAIVLDADGLWGLTPARIQAAVSPSGAQVVLTPHDGEAAQLLGHDPGPNRRLAAEELAALSGCTVLLKGPSTVVASPEPRLEPTRFIVSGDERLATTGTGDVLAGVVGAFLAYGLSPVLAASLAAQVHGQALDLAPPSLVAGELPRAIAQMIDQFRQGSEDG
ncbi:MAG: NAD(P)H-hydrate dehydratase [Actinomycetota bacterium]